MSYNGDPLKDQHQFKRAQNECLPKLQTSTTPESQRQRAPASGRPHSRRQNLLLRHPSLQALKVVLVLLCRKESWFRPRIDYAPLELKL